VIDSSDEERFSLAKQELQKLLRHELLQHCPVLVYANKRDQEGAASLEQVTKALELHKEHRRRKWFVQSTCALNGFGLYEGLDWLSKQL